MYLVVELHEIDQAKKHENKDKESLHHPLQCITNCAWFVSKQSNIVPLKT